MVKWAIKAGKRIACVGKYVLSAVNMSLNKTKQGTCKNRKKRDVRRKRPLECARTYDLETRKDTKKAQRKQSLQRLQIAGRML